VNGRWLRAAGARRQCAPAALTRRFWAPLNFTVRPHPSMSRVRLLPLILIVAACSPLRGCVESQFTLASDSRLPLWFASPPVVDRANASVELTYWTNGDAVFALKHRNGWLTVREVSGQSCWHPRTRYKKNPDGTQAPPRGPEYVIVSVHGVVDVVEHVKTPALFRMTDNEEIIREAKESIARGECRHEP
jgi:hypothetical protein